MGTTHARLWIAGMLTVLTALAGCRAVGDAGNTNASTRSGQSTQPPSSPSPPPSSPPPHAPYPFISGTPPTSVTAGQAYSFQPQVRSTGGTVLFSIANKPSWANFDVVSGLLSGTPASSDVGSYAGIQISVSSGQARASLAPFGITVIQPAPPSPVTLSWNPPTQNTDGTPLTNLAGYKILYGTQSHTYTQTITVSNPGLTTYVVDGLFAGTYYFTVTAYNTAGATSMDSPEVAALVH